MSFRESLTEEEFDNISTTATASLSAAQSLNGQTKAALLAEAHRRFPKGTLFLQFEKSDLTVSTGVFNWQNDPSHGQCIAMNDEYETYVWTEDSEWFVDGNWVEVYEPPNESLVKAVKEVEEMVDHPNHYGGKDNTYEAIKIIEHFDLNFCLGNVIKYILRAGKKDDLIQDLEKATWYLGREISKLKKQ